MKSKVEFLEEIKTDILEWAAQLAKEYDISQDDALHLVKGLIREEIQKDELANQ